jgi:hypothetical protein
MLGIQACEEEEIVYPEIDALQGNKAQVNYGDTLILTFEASEIDQYRINILQGSRVIPTEFNPIFREGDYFEAELIFTDRYLESGSYDLRIQVFKNGVGNSLIRPFTYSGLSLQQTGIALLSNQALEFWDNAGNLSRSFPLNKRFDVLKIDPRDSLIYLASLQDEGVEIRHLKDFRLVASIPPPLGANRKSYSTTLKTEHGLYLFQMDGNTLYLESGIVDASAFHGQSGQVYFSREACLVDQNPATISAFADGSSAQATIYNQALFELYARPLQGLYPQMTALSEDELAIILYQANTGIWTLNYWDVSAGLFGAEKTFIADSVFDIVHFNGNEVIYATSEGLQRYAFFNNLNTITIDPSKFENFQKRKTDQALFLQKGNIVQQLLLNNNLQFAASSTNRLLDYEILYNK